MRLSILNIVYLVNEYCEDSLPREIFRIDINKKYLNIQLQPTMVV